MRHHRFSHDDYARLIASGILAEVDHVELMDGAIFAMHPVDIRHSCIVSSLTTAIIRQTTDDVLALAYCPLRLPNDSVPQADIALVHANYDGDRYPAPADTLLVIEVADTSLAYDRDVKLPLYAAAGIPEAWLVDIAAGRIERHTAPSGDGYGAIIVARRGAAVTSTTVPAVSVAVDAIFA